MPEFNMFDMPEYNQAMDAQESVLGDVRSQALQRMMERQASTGTLRAGGITDYPAMDIEKMMGTQRAQYGGQLALQQAGTKIRRQESQTAYDRQLEMFQKQVEAQRTLMNEQAELQKRMQGDMFGQNLMQSLIGTGVGALTGGLFSGLGALGRGVASGFKPMKFEGDLGTLMTSAGMPEGFFKQQQWLSNMGTMGIDPMTMAIYQMLSKQGGR